jgi:hypothetical protein
VGAGDAAAWEREQPVQDGGGVEQHRMGRRRHPLLVVLLRPLQGLAHGGRIGACACVVWGKEGRRISRPPAVMRRLGACGDARARAGEQARRLRRRFGLERRGFVRERNGIAPTSPSPRSTPCPASAAPPTGQPHGTTPPCREPSAVPPCLRAPS